MTEILRLRELPSAPHTHTHPGSVPHCSPLVLVWYICHSCWTTWLCQFFRLPLFFVTLTVLSSIGQVICRKIICWNLMFFCCCFVVVVAQLAFGYGFWGWIPQRCLLPHHMKANILSAWFITVMLTWITWLRLHLSRFSTVELLPTPTFFHQYAQPTSEECPVRMECLHMLFGILPKGKYVFSPCICSSVIYLYQYGLTDL